MSSLETSDLSLSQSDIDYSASLRRRLERVHSVCFSVARAFPLRAMPFVCKRLSALLLPPIRGPVITPTVFGFDICATPGAGENYYYLGFYELGTLGMMENMLRPGDTFVDIGASEGQMSARASQLVGDGGRVISLEPHAQRFHDLANTIHLNGFRNVTPLRLGAGSSPGKAPLYTDIISPTFRHSENLSRFETVDIQALDQILASHGISTVAMIKIDVEGFELEVLRGSANILSSDDAPILCVEVGIQEVGHRQVADLLSQYNNFKLYRLSHSKSCYSKLVSLSRCDDFGRHDNIFCIPEGRLADLPTDLFAGRR